MQNNPIQLAVIDMAGTTVADDGLVVNAFEAAATAVGVPASGPERDNARQYVLDTMGQSKISVFRALFGSEDHAQQANAAFELAYEQLIDEGNAAPIHGAAEAVTRLRENGIRVALTTGFSGATQEKLLAALGWQSLADLVLAPGEGVRGRPYPDSSSLRSCDSRSMASPTLRRSVTPATTSKARCGRGRPSPPARSPARTTSNDSALRERPTSSGPSPHSPI